MRAWQKRWNNDSEAFIEDWTSEFLSRRVRGLSDLLARDSLRLHSFVSLLVSSVDSIPVRRWIRCLGSSDSIDSGWSRCDCLSLGQIRRVQERRGQRQRENLSHRSHSRHNRHCNYVSCHYRHEKTSEACDWAVQRSGESYFRHAADSLWAFTGETLNKRLWQLSKISLCNFRHLLCWHWQSRCGYISQLWSKALESFKHMNQELRWRLVIIYLNR